MGEEEIIVVKTFGVNEIRLGEIIINEEIGNSKKVWGFLIYMIKHRSKPNLQRTLISIFWEDKGVRNPYNSLKTLVYRIRNIFTDAGYPWGQDIILSKKNTYIWNDMIPIEADFEIFEKLCGQLFTDNIPLEDEIEVAKKAFELYQGEFLGEYVSEKWVGCANAYYHSLYVRLVCYLIELYKRKDMYEEIIDLCQKAIQIDRTIEEFHYNLVYAYLKENKIWDANIRYIEATELLSHRYGMELSEKFKILYHQVIESENQIEFSIKKIKDDMAGDKKKTGAFVCDYTVFKKIYNLDRRYSERHSRNTFLVLISIMKKEDADDISYLREINNYFEIVAKSLRRSDVLSRCNRNQLVILLQANAEENVQCAMERVDKNYRKAYPGSEIWTNLNMDLVK